MNTHFKDEPYDKIPIYIISLMHIGDKYILVPICMN